MGYCVEKLAPEAIDERMRKIVCDLWVNGIEFHSQEEPNIA